MQFMKPPRLSSGWPLPVTFSSLSYVVSVSQEGFSSIKKSASDPAG
ncbi:hypothetical protein AC519_2577 [Pseudomonas savastanoi]|nr:hypothetical protein AC519_2577 [Pseudomonas savastanoi]